MESNENMSEENAAPNSHELSNDRVKRPELRHVSSQTDEIQEDADQSSNRPRPPRLVITTQPHGENRTYRIQRSLSPSRERWAASPTERVFSGLFLLRDIEQLEVQKIVDLSTLLGKADSGRQYRIKIPGSDTLFLAIEIGTPNEQGLFKYSRGFILRVTDQFGETSFTVKKNTNISSSLHKITVEDKTAIGTVEQNFTLLAPSFTVYDESHKTLCIISGPNVFGCCMYRESQFQVTSADGTSQVASLMRQYNNILHEYTLLLTFPQDTNIRLKILLLSATLLLDHVYFEHKKQR